MTYLIFFAAAIFEIGGCYLVWLAARQSQPWLWLPALAALGLFGYLLSLTGTESAGRAFAVYGGIYILSSLAFMGAFEGRPDRWDLIGAGLALAGASVIYFAPRGCTAQSTLPNAALSRESWSATPLARPGVDSGSLPRSKASSCITRSNRRSPLSMKSLSVWGNSS